MKYALLIPDWSALNLGIGACLHASRSQKHSSKKRRDSKYLTAGLCTNMEDGTALPDRPASSNTPKNPQDARDNGKPAPKALSENSKPPKAKKEKAPKIPKPPKGPTIPKVKKESAAKPSVEDPESMFKVGFLSDVYQERPVGPEGISKVITRCEFLSIQV